jgi:hypothetical protein
LDFDLDHETLQPRGFQVPFKNIAQPEQALIARLFRPTRIMGCEGIKYHVLAYHPKPVVYSGFIVFVKYSLALNDLGLYEV